MAVTTEELSIALRLTADGTGLSVAQTSILTRLMGVGDAHVELLIPNAPDDIKDECTVRLATYLYDAPIGRKDSYSNAWTNSGAGALASRWHQQAVSDGASPGASPSSIVDGIDEAAVLALFAPWAQVNNTDQIPADKLLNAGGGLGTDTDNVARQAAAEALAAAVQNAADIADLSPSFPMTRTEVFSASITSSLQDLMATENWLTGQLYELVFGSTRHLFLTEGDHLYNYGVNYFLPGSSSATVFVDVVAILRIGTQNVFSVRLDNAGPASGIVKINKLT